MNEASIQKLRFLIDFHKDATKLSFWHENDKRDEDDKVCVVLFFLGRKPNKQTLFVSRTE